MTKEEWLAQRHYRRLRFAESIAATALVAAVLWLAWVWV